MLAEQSLQRIAEIYVLIRNVRINAIDTLQLPPGDFTPRARFMRANGLNPSLSNTLNAVNRITPLAPRTTLHD